MALNQILLLTYFLDSYPLTYSRGTHTELIHHKWSSEWSSEIQTSMSVFVGTALCAAPWWFALSMRRAPARPIKLENDGTDGRNDTRPLNVTLIARLGQRSNLNSSCPIRDCGRCMKPYNKFQSVNFAVW